MKFRTLKNWQNLEQLEGLVFFVQLLEELLFDYSLDTYKPSAMNSSTLCLETLELIKDIENEVIDQANLPHVLEELAMNLKRDEIVQSLMDIDIDSVCSQILNADTNLYQIKVTVQIIYSQIRLPLYKEKNENLLFEAVRNGREKNRIRGLTRSYVSSLITLGYSNQYLYAVTRRIFHWGDSKIHQPEDVRLFFNVVKGDPIEYQVLFKGDSLFLEIADSCEKLDISISRDVPAEMENHLNAKNFSLDGGEDVYLICEKVSSLDVFSARESVERRLDRLSALTNIFHHKQVPSWSKGALLINKSVNSSRMVPASRNPMHMCSDRRSNDAANDLYKFIENFSLAEKQSFQKYTRAVELHALALRSDSPENQLLNLWVSLETITPGKLNRNKAKINNIIDSTLPFLSLTYLHSLTDRLVQDFKLWNARETFSLLKPVPGESDRERLIKLLVLPQYEDQKHLLYKSLGDFHLLRNRAHYFSENLSSTKKIKGIIDNHWLRVSWQIRRIYRARNQIVHAGHTPAHINILIKNVHDYLDVVMGRIADLAADGDKINTLDQAYRYVELFYKDFRASLGDGPVDDNNIDQILISRNI
ncbi:hypothetical protein [Marinobacter sp. NFXS9]|uniref:hypothetical protein n=1 Tax=Marinobacter sp. NFXS9 TaxID=2818433 RepID=UPI0032DF16C3